MSLAVTGLLTRSLSHCCLYIPEVTSVLMEEVRLRAPILVLGNQNGKKHLILRLNKELPKHDNSS